MVMHRRLYEVLFLKSVLSSYPHFYNSHLYGHHTGLLIPVCPTECLNSIFVPNLSFLHRSTDKILFISPFYFQEKN